MLLVNMVEDDEEAREVFRKISLVVDRFLGHRAIDYVGFIPFDEKLPAAVKQQRAILELYPRAPASRRFAELARRLAERPVQNNGEGQIQFFWRQLLQSRPLWDQKGECG